MAKKKTKTSTKTSSKKIPSFKVSNQQKIIFGSLLMLLSVACVIAFISYFSTWQEDQSLLKEFGNRQAEAKNWLNKFGASVSHLFIYKGFGIAAFIFPILLFQTGLYLFLNYKLKLLTNRWFWGIIVSTWLAIFFGFFSESAPLLGGVVGFEMNDFLRAYIGKIGVALLLFFIFITYAVTRLGVTPQKIKALFYTTQEEFKAAFKSNKVKAEGNEPETATSYTETSSTQEPKTVSNSSEPDTTSDVDIENSFEIKLAEEEEELAPPTLKTQAPSSNNENDELKIEVETVEEEKEEIDNLSEKLVKDFGEFDPKLALSNYKFPTLELLNDYGSGSITINQEELEENKNKIVDTLKNYKIEISQIKATIGPTVTLYEIVPAAGVRISKIKNLEDDIALSLAALGIRIIAPIPGKGTIGIEVPNKNSTIVSMRSVIASKKFQAAEMELPIAFGKTISNETFVVDLAKMPHLLMAGATGQGKSVGLNAILTSLLYKKHPAEVKFVLVDPKKVELTLFNKIERHFLAKLPDSEEAIITDNTKVINTLNSLCIEMDNRYEMLKNAMVRNIKEYNTKFKARKLNPNDGHQFLPYIVLVIDEFADLIMTAGKEVETPIARLAQLARAIGIHLIVATQRPSVNVITGIIKANFPARVAFRVTSKIDSRTILDSPGADQLIGRGDMLYTQGNDLTRLQCAFVDTPEVDKITDFIGGQRAYPDAHLLPEYVGEESGTGLDIDISERDALFREAAEVIVIAQQGSASLLQRKLKLGYNRAGRIIDQLEAAGIVGPFEGSKARQVLVPDMVALDQLLNNE
ncbi:MULTISPECIES: DNA translocase FtsK [Galbibacter]|uniref:DNA segregation ATPase, FtsK/SpoIIIE family n=1 Tax=Galbibacter orientalis DSM 19592 TaxID=926559 RepID=I3CAN4_9FLAO|nr:DNA translocase FtsK [Galbibacter orientalis]EIJ40677.1 DNA segregation ATPase, FtsK/SpoIIIE family [Galbibacter orientalis DSM 19592]